jgi:hypothetical protein
MNNELQRRLYEMEVMPPAAVWEKLSVDIDEINADNLFAAKITTAEVLAPVSAWQKISLGIDEINSDSIISKKIIGTEVLPPPSTWEKINNTINPPQEVYRERKGRIVNFRRLAAAAVLIGIIVTVWILINNNNIKTVSVASAEETPVVPVLPNATNSNPRTNDTVVKNLDVVQVAPGSSKYLVTREKNDLPTNRHNKIYASAGITKTELSALNNEIPGGKSFDKPIDDLSLVTANDNYLTMVNANGRLVKIPAQFAQLVPHLQDKPLSEDLFEVMFGEGTYWKETMTEWRKKLISSPVSSGDAFTSLVELLKTVQDK